MEQLHQLSHSGVSLIFTTPALLPNLHQAFQLASSSSKFSVPKERIILLTGKASRPRQLADFACLEEVAGTPMDPERFENGDEGETVIMCYSSGTVSCAQSAPEWRQTLTIPDRTGEGRRDDPLQHDVPDASHQHGIRTQRHIA